MATVHCQSSKHPFSGSSKQPFHGDRVFGDSAGSHFGDAFVGDSFGRGYADASISNVPSRRFDDSKLPFDRGTVRTSDSMTGTFGNPFTGDATSFYPDRIGSQRGYTTAKYSGTKQSQGVPWDYNQVSQGDSHGYFSQAPDFMGEPQLFRFGTPREHSRWPTPSFPPQGPPFGHQPNE